MCNCLCMCVCVCVLCVLLCVYVCVCLRVRHICVCVCAYMYMFHVCVLCVSVCVHMCCFNHVWRHCSRTTPGLHVHLVNTMHAQNPVSISQRPLAVCLPILYYLYTYLSLYPARTHTHTHTHTHTPQCDKEDCSRRWYRSIRSIHDSVCIALEPPFFFGFCTWAKRTEQVRGTPPSTVPDQPGHPRQQTHATLHKA